MTGSRMTLWSLAWLLLAGGLLSSTSVIAETAGAPPSPSAEATETTTQTTSGAESANESTWLLRTEVDHEHGRDDEGQNSTA